MNSTVASKPAPYQELMEFLGKREASWAITADAVDEIIDLLGGPSKRPKAEGWPAAQAPQPDANGWYYHRAPTVDRARIQQHGLQPSRPRNNPHWPDSRLVRNQPEGVYVAPDPEGVSYMLGGPTDVWRIPATSVQSIERDPAMYGKGYIPHRVDDAELWQPYERSNSFTGVPMSDEDLFWNADYPHQLAYDLDHYDEQRQQGNPWKIGLPTTAALTTGWKIHERSDERQSQTSVSQTTDIWTNAHEANAALWELADLMRKIPANQQAQANEVMRHEGVKSAIAYVLKLLQQQWTITPTETQHQPQEPYDDASVWIEPALGPLDGVWSSVRQSGMTVPQYQRAMAELEAKMGPDRSKLVHQFDNGWSIAAPKTERDVRRTGLLMGHCWQSGFAGKGDPHVLRDPYGIPRVAFNTTYAHTEGDSYVPHGAENDLFRTVLVNNGTHAPSGHNSSPPKPEHWAMLNEWGNTFDPPIQMAHYTGGQYPQYTSQYELGPIGPNPYWNETTQGWIPKTADNFTNDSREWPDPTEPRASKPPAPRGCTCQWGDKLNCPVHGLNADPELAQLDHSWSLPENSPVGYPQDQPRSWTQAT